MAVFESERTMYYIYMLRCESDLLYTGITTDVERRFKEHKDGNKGAKYTKAHKPLGVEAVWETESKIAAAKLEYKIKQLSKAEKEDLIANGAAVLTMKDKNCELIFKRMC